MSGNETVRRGPRMRNHLILVIIIALGSQVCSQLPVEEVTCGFHRIREDTVLTFKSHSRYPVGKYANDVNCKYTFKVNLQLGYFIKKILGV